MSPLWEGRTRWLAALWLVMAGTAVGCAASAPKAGPAATAELAPAATPVVASVLPRCAEPPAVTQEERSELLARVHRIGRSKHWEVLGAMSWPAGQDVVALRKVGEVPVRQLVSGSRLVVSEQGDGLVAGQAMGSGADQSDRATLLVADEAPRQLPFPVSVAAFSLDGMTLFAQDGLGTLRSLDVASGATRAERALGASAHGIELGSGIVIVETDYHTYASFDPTTLAPIMSPTTGTLSPSRRLLVAVEADPPAVHVYQTTSGRMLASVRTSEQIWNEAILVTPDDRRVIYPDGGISVLDVATKRVRVAPWLDLGEGDAESRRAAAPTVDGRYLCQAMDNHDVTYDLHLRRQLGERPGLGVRCMIVDGVGVVVRAPLKPHEVVLELYGEGFGNHSDFVVSPDRTRAALLTVDGRLDLQEPRPIDLLVVEIASGRVLHRIHVGTIAEGGWTPSLWVDDDHHIATAFYVASSGGVDLEQVTVEWRTAAISRSVGSNPRREPHPPETESVRSAVAEDAIVTLRGATILVRGSEVTEAWRLDAAHKLHRRLPTERCSAELSPAGGAFVRRCDLQDRVEVVWLDGRATSSFSLAGGMTTALAVAESGTVAYGGFARLGLIDERGDHPLDASQGGGAYTALAFSPDGRHLAAWHAGDQQLTLFDLAKAEVRWQHQAEIHSAPLLRFSDDSKVVALGVGYRGTVGSAFDVAAGTAIDDAAVGLGFAADRIVLGNLLPFGSGRQGALSIVSPQRRDMPTSGSVVGDLLVTSAAGVARIHRLSDGATMATLLPLRFGGAIALFEDGRVDWVGGVAETWGLLCRRGDTLAEASGCAPLTDHGALERLFAPPACSPSTPEVVPPEAG